MHAPVLLLVTAFAASVAAAPLPITPIESPVEGLAVRDAEAALSPAQMEALKRSIFERLEEIVPVKRSYEDDVLDPDTIDKRWKTTGENDKRQDGTYASQPANDKRQDGTVNTVTSAHDRRDPQRGSEVPNSVERRSRGTEVDGTLERRQSNSQYQAGDAADKRDGTVNAPPAAHDRRQDGTVNVVTSAHDRRQDGTVNTVTSAHDRRQDGTVNAPPAAHDRRQDGTVNTVTSAHDKRQDGTVTAPPAAHDK